MSSEWKPLILVVEDDVDAVFLVGRLLVKSEIDHQMLHLGDGEQAIRYLKSGPTGPARPALILLDIKMPKINGLEVLAWLRAEGDGTIPVVMMTTSDDPRDQERARSLQADAFIPKFPPAAEFRELLRKLLSVPSHSS